ncbi:FimB/Mfa2 family fimbrial subunit, partial [Phocaeicola sp.]
MKVSAYIKRMGMWTLFLAAAGFTMTSCDNILGEENVDCSVEFRVKFKYDMNMKFADAFANEVKSVTLYGFDEEGRLAFQKTEQGDILAEDGYTMLLDDPDIKDGDYDLITWGGLEGEESFAVPILSEGSSTLEDLNCRMDRDYITRAADGSATVTKDLSPLFHGQVQKCSISRAATQKVITVPLMKNTNNVRVVLQHLSGSPVDVSKFTFTIEDENGLMNYDNALMDDDELTYYAWRKDAGVADMNEDGTRATTAVGVAIAELTVGRLVEANNPILT